MRGVRLAIGALLFSVAGVLFLTSMHEAVATCPGSDSVQWDPQTDSTSDVGGEFEYYAAFLEWHFRDPPYIGVAEIATSFSQNISSVTYTPDYFYPNACEGATNIWMTGTITGSSGTLTTKGYCWDSGSPPPYAENFQVLTIN